MAKAMIAKTESVFTTQARVLGALILRDMRTRFGRSHSGFLIAVGWPFCHIFIIVGIMVFRGLPTPLGHNITLFVTTGLIPYIGFMYMSRKMMESVGANRPLLFFPQVKSLDLLMARSVLEIITFFGSTIITFSVLLLLGIDAFPVYPAEAVAAFCSIILLSIGVGSLNACMASFFPAYAMGYVLVIIAFYTLSGVFFVPEFLPGPIFDVLSWNPMLQCIMWFRSAFYPGYGAQVDKSFVLLCGLTFLGIGLLLDRFAVRRFGQA